MGWWPWGHRPVTRDRVVEAETAVAEIRSVMGRLGKVADVLEAQSARRRKEGEASGEHP